MPKKPRTRVEPKPMSATLCRMAPSKRKAHEAHVPPEDPNVAAAPEYINWRLPNDVRNAIQRYWARKLYRNTDAQNATALVRNLLYQFLNEGGYFEAD